MNAAGTHPPVSSAELGSKPMKIAVGVTSFVLTSSTALAVRQQLDRESVIPVDYVSLAFIAAAILAAVWIVRIWDARGRDGHETRRAAKRLARRLRQIDGIVDPIIEGEADED